MPSPKAAPAKVNPAVTNADANESPKAVSAAFSASSIDIPVNNPPKNVATPEIAPVIAEKSKAFTKPAANAAKNVAAPPVKTVIKAPITIQVKPISSSTQCFFSQSKTFTAISAITLAILQTLSHK